MTKPPQKKRSATTHASIEKVATSLREDLKGTKQKPAKQKKDEEIITCDSIEDTATSLRKQLKGTKQEAGKKIILLFAYNGIGKTRLSMAFKEQAKKAKDTLYFNAFTEDLFTWDNDPEHGNDRKLKLNTQTKFFNLLDQGLEIDSKVRVFLNQYADFDFEIGPDNRTVHFSRTIQTAEKTETVDNIKISRGEENIFIWCFFLAIVQLVIDKQEAYKWVKYIYIDDPISSLDDNNVIVVASHLAQTLKDKDNQIKIVISSHHGLFFNILCNEFSNKKSYFLDFNKAEHDYILQNTSSTPFFHHIVLLKHLKEAVKSGTLYTYHFNILRGILEKTAVFHGFNHFSDCLQYNDKDKDNDKNKAIYKRMINVMSHGNYSLFEPREMGNENKEHFKKILEDFMKNYHFNNELFNENSEQQK